MFALDLSAQTYMFIHHLEARIFPQPPRGREDFSGEAAEDWETAS